MLTTYRCLNGTAPHYLAAETIRPVSSRGTRHQLRFTEMSTLLVPSTRRSTLGDRSFPVAAARAWNALPHLVRNAPSFPAFRRELKTFLFRSSFPDAIYISIFIYIFALVYLLNVHKFLLVKFHLRSTEMSLIIFSNLFFTENRRQLDISDLLHSYFGHNTFRQ